jgi:hypothetical protein
VQIGSKNIDLLDLPCCCVYREACRVWLSYGACRGIRDVSAVSYKGFMSLTCCWLITHIPLDSNQLKQRKLHQRANCTAQHFISVSTTANFIRTQSPTFWVRPSLIVRSEVYIWKQFMCICACICVCVYTDSGVATLDGRVQNEYLKWRNFTWYAQQILNYWSKSKYIK